MTQRVAQRARTGVAVLGMTGLAILTAASAAAQGASSTAIRMHRVVETFVERTGHEILGVGSWISGKGYSDALNTVGRVSDHDMRLLLPRGTPPGAARDAWVAGRRELIGLIRNEFGKDAGRILAQTNLYPPTQLVQGVENATDVMDVFVENQMVPNLAHEGTITENTAGRFVEGLYGPGADGYIQSYERDAGQLFYRSRNAAGNPAVYRGMVDLTHLSEGPARFSIRGTANTAVQWSQHATDALRAGNSENVVKFLRRYARDITKCRDLARRPLTAIDRTTGELVEMAARLEENPRSLGLSRAAIQGLLRRAELEATLLGHLDHPNPIVRAAARVAIDGLEAGSELGVMLRRASEQVSGELVGRALILALGTYMVGRDIVEDDVPGIYDGVVMTISGFVPVTTAAEILTALTPSAMVTLTHMLLEKVREDGYDVYAGRQEAFDLLDGIFATGAVADRRYAIDELVRMIHSEEGLRSFLFARAREAAARDIGTATGEDDLKVAESIYRQCLPVILAAWNWRRAELMSELALLGEAIEDNAAMLTYRPSPAVPTGGAADVTVTAISSDVDEGQKLARSREILRVLLGAGQPVYALVSTSWRPDGQGSPDRPERSYRLPAGQHEIEFEERISIGAANLPRNSPLQRDIVRRASVTVDVGDRAASPPPPAPPTSGGPWKPPFPRVTSQRLGASWQVDGPYYEPYFGRQEVQAAHWSLDALQGGERVVVQLYAVYGDGPVEDWWQWDPSQRRLGAGQPIALPYGDDARDWSNPTTNDYERSAAFLVRWGLLIVQVSAGGGATMETLDAAAKVVLQDIARQLEPLRPSGGGR